MIGSGALAEDLAVLLLELRGGQADERIAENGGGVSDGLIERRVVLV